MIFLSLKNSKKTRKEIKKASFKNKFFFIESKSFKKAYLFSTRKSGSALVYGLVIMTVVCILLTSIISFVASQLKFSSHRIEQEVAFQIAEAGIYYYRWYLAHATAGMNVQQLRAFWQDSSTLGVSEDFSQNYYDPQSGQLLGAYTIHLDPPDIYSTIATITSTGTSAKTGLERKVKVRFRRPSWSEYMWIVHSYVFFGDDAVVYGRVHSNTGIRFDGTAYNTVSSHVPRFTDPDHSTHNPEFGVHTHINPRDPVAPSYPWPEGTVPNRPDIFRGGRQFPVPEINFTGVQSDLNFMKKTACNFNENTNSCSIINGCWEAGCYFNNAGAGRRIILKTDGTFDICTVNTGRYNTTTLSIYTSGNNNYLRVSGSGACGSCSGLCLANYNIPQNGVIFVENNAWVEGTINNKRVTIAAANLTGSGSLVDIFLGYINSPSNNLLYTNHDGRDVIGLVGQRNIRIGRDCPSDFTIEAALLAQDQTGKVSHLPTHEEIGSTTRPW